MKVTVTLEALTSVVSLAALTTIKDASSIFSHLLIEPDGARMLVKSTNQMTSTSSVLYYTSLSENPRAFTVESEPLTKWLSTLEGDEVALEVTPDSIVATCGRSVSYFRTMRPDSFPQILSTEGVGAVEVDATALFECLDYARHGLPDASGDGKIKENMRLVRFRDASAIATDGGAACYVAGADLGEGVLLDLKVGLQEVPSLLAFLKKAKGQKITMCRDRASVLFSTKEGSVFGFSEPAYDHVTDFRTQLNFSDVNQPVLFLLNMQDFAKAYKSVSASASVTSKTIVLEIPEPSTLVVEGDEPVMVDMILQREGTSAKNVNSAYLRMGMVAIQSDRVTFPMRLTLRVDQVLKVLAVMGTQSAPINFVVSPKFARISMLDANGLQKFIFCSYST